MAREWRKVVSLSEVSGGGINQGLGTTFVVFWVAIMVTLSVISAIIVSCADGASKDKASATNKDTYGSTCAAGCGAGCGA